jgi:hypothetical protein
MDDHSAALARNAKSLTTEDAGFHRGKAQRRGQNFLCGFSLSASVLSVVRIFA